MEEHKGLSEHEAKIGLLKYGLNELSDSNRISVFSLLIEQYKNVISIILLLAAIFALTIGEFVDSIFIGVILIFNGLFGFVQQFRAEKTLEKLKGLTAPVAKVVRNGEEEEVEAIYLIPGDIVKLLEGDRIPADGIIISDLAVEIDEAVLTGESLPVEKGKKNPIYSGTYVIRGKCYMRVEATGYATRMGKIAKALVNVKKPKTPLSVNLDDLGKKFAFIGMFFALLLVPIGILQGRDLQHIILTAINLSVALVPEGLPLVVTVALAVGAYRLAREKTIVRKMIAIETLGATTAILTDKTGTVTQNKMVVKEYYLEKEKNISQLLKACVLGNTATLVFEERNSEVEILGDKTDGALLMFANSQIKNLESFRSEGKLISEKPFNPETKTIEIVWQDKNKNKIEFVRGAPESIFKMAKVDENAVSYKKFEEMVNLGLRVIAFCEKKKGQSNPILIGLIGIYDPPRIEAKEALKQAKNAGIRVVMVTGDNPKTARHIANEIGMIEEGEIVMTSEELSKLTDDDLISQIPKVRIFARMKPEDKSRLVKLYRRAGFVVAVTGDGVNDALALSESNIGISMGKTGTDVAKEASDVIITDDDLNTIIKAVEEGRGIFDNIVKVVIFLFSSNIAELLLIFIGILLGLPIPLTVTQILWVNLVSDSLPALALSMDTKRENLLLNKPRKVTENVLNKERFLFILKITIPFVIILIVSYFVALQFYPVEFAQTLVFNYLVIGEMMIVFIVRRGLFPFNKFLVFSVLITVFVQTLTILVPFLRDLLI